ncbi:hydroxypyruvate isomerase [Denitromonas ohlonensis]|uniref:Hydroxypyruvate isomerase n=2 Tax=Denitromonas TaxID=139331 RepID=A0A557SNG2_9RHOO|nr:hydroxypyruvate isomerase [Denitromonas ohlonensis]TVO62648.1 hydroxypyruvate isomerase [Denitromonas ohlonensis]TVO78852.1 hydroxypyruvate isomerase [Denitromonas ohlonensis]TVT45586.1 MAG: hydroxypyruvate isomerase [Denitromonas halophila]TVT74492.1 MAG: hydroxypyruvate isomerase [Denitromonas halophila]
MPKFAANLTLLFNEQAFLDRFAAAADAGFEGVEYLFPYAWPAAQLVEALQTNALVQVLHNLPPGDWDAGERGIACHPDRVGEFQDGVGRGIDYARALGCPQLNCLAGIRPEGVDPERALATFVDNLRFAASALKAAGLRLLIEPINTFDIPGFFLNRTEQAAQIAAAVGVDNLFIQYDIYHAQRMEGELANTLSRYLPMIGHMQLADTPGRHEPGTGEINFPFLFRHIDALGYTGWIGCEYKPIADTLSGLGWRPAE